MRVFKEDFESFDVGVFPHDYSPLGEYHCVVPKGFRGRWLELTIYHGWRGVPGWIIAEEDGNRFLEHSAFRSRIPSIISSGDELWEDYRVDARVRLLSDDGYVGVAARMEHSLSLIHI